MNAERVPSRVCKVPGCPSVQYRERLPEDLVVGFTQFPVDPARRSLWFRKLGCIPSKKLRLFLCLLHFEDHHIRKVGYNGVPLAKYSVEDSAVPTLNLLTSSAKSLPASSANLRSIRTEPLLIGSPRKKQRSDAECELAPKNSI